MANALYFVILIGGSIISFLVLRLLLTEASSDTELELQILLKDFHLEEYETYIKESGTYIYFINRLTLLTPLKKKLFSTLHPTS